MLERRRFSGWASTMSINLIMTIYAMFVVYLDEDGFHGELHDEHQLKASICAMLERRWFSRWGSIMSINLIMLIRCLSYTWIKMIIRMKLHDEYEIESNNLYIHHEASFILVYNSAFVFMSDLQCVSIIIVDFVDVFFFSSQKNVWLYAFFVKNATIQTCITYIRFLYYRYTHFSFKKYF